MTGVVGTRATGAVRREGIPASTDWRHQAACLELADPDAVFHPVDPDDPEALALARRWCDRCPVAAPCLAFAMTGNVAVNPRGGMLNIRRGPITDGIWAGTGPLRRRVLWERQQRAHRAAPADGLDAGRTSRAARRSRRAARADAIPGGGGQ
jgi:hypothetical protein